MKRDLDEIPEDMAKLTHEFSVDEVAEFIQKSLYRDHLQPFFEAPLTPHQVLFCVKWINGYRTG